jgi:hypothetical protein
MPAVAAYAAHQAVLHQQRSMFGADVRAATVRSSHTLHDQDRIRFPLHEGQLQRPKNGIGYAVLQ